MAFLEVCAYNIQTCRVADSAGAARIELCADPTAGGVTPSMGLIAYTLEHLSIPVFPMIRPRGGDFVFDKDEIALMKKDISLCKAVGCSGIATGVQLSDGGIDRDLLSMLVEWAYPMVVTCHKVFDRAPDLFGALEVVIAAGCTRILTSGGKKNAGEGAQVIADLIKQAASRIVIMPGGGIRSGNIVRLKTLTGAGECHSSGLTDPMYQVASEDEIRSMVNQLK